MLKSFGICLNNRIRSAIVRNYAFVSDISLKNLHSNSSLKLATPSPPPPRPDGKFNGYIPMNEISVTYSRSTGPGGQNVNKVESKVDLIFHVETAQWIAEPIREKLAEKYKNKINKEGFFIIKSELTRFQHMNLADALERLRNIIRQIEDDTAPKELSAEKIAKIQRGHEKAARERLFVKRMKSQDKKNRQAG